MTTKDPIVLLVDDSKTNASLMKIVFERGGFRQPLRFACDGDDAIAYLLGEGCYHDRTKFPLPTLVLMDLNMPRRNGLETLKWIRQQPAFKRLHVYILSGSSRSEDIEMSYELGANSYLVRPGNLTDLVQMAKSLDAWLKLIHVASLNIVEGDSAAGPADGGAQGDEPGFQRENGS